MGKEKNLKLVERMDRIRNANAMTWLEFAGFIGISRQYLSFIKAGARVPGPKIERRIREAEKDIEIKKGGYLFAVREEQAQYAMRDEQQLLLNLATENAAIKAHLAELDKELKANDAIKARLAELDERLKEMEKRNGI